MAKLVQCDVHGQAPGYVVCLHIPGRKAAYVEKATEYALSQAVCAECHAPGRNLTVDDAKLICAGCFADADAIDENTEVKE